MRGRHPCPLRSACRLRGALREARDAFYATLDPITVTDLVASPTGPLLLGIGSRPRPAEPRPAARTNPHADGAALYQ